MKQKIIIIDTGAANIHSVEKAFKFIGANVEITKDPTVIKKSDAIVFPGVGAFASVMEGVKKNNLDKPIKQCIEANKPFLGICVGMQALFEESEEFGNSKGLGILKGKVVRFKKAKTIPHVGWNKVTFVGEDNYPRLHNAEFYFVHSYYVIPEDKSIILGETEYEGEKFTSMIKKDNLFAVQFHPEKSGEAGLELLRKFIKEL